MWHHTWRKNWVNCAVLTQNSVGLRTVLSSRLSHRELRSSLRESHSFLSLPADTTMTSSQGTSVSSNSFSRWASHDIFLFKYHFLLHILCFLFFFSNNIMADASSKQRTIALWCKFTVPVFFWCCVHYRYCCGVVYCTGIVVLLCTVSVLLWCCVQYRYCCVPCVE